MSLSPGIRIDLRLPFLVELKLMSDNPAPNSNTSDDQSDAYTHNIQDSSGKINPEYHDLLNNPVTFPHPANSPTDLSNNLGGISNLGAQTPTPLVLPDQNPPQPYTPPSQPLFSTVVEPSSVPYSETPPEVPHPPLTAQTVSDPDTTTPHLVTSIDDVPQAPYPEGSQPVNIPAPEPQTTPQFQPPPEPNPSPPTPQPEPITQIYQPPAPMQTPQPQVEQPQPTPAPIQSEPTPKPQPTPEPEPDQIETKPVEKPKTIESEIPPPMGDSQSAESYINQIITLINQGKLDIKHTDLKQFDPTTLQDHYRIDLDSYEIEISHSLSPDSQQEFFIILFNNLNKIAADCTNKQVLAYIHLDQNQFADFKQAADIYLEKKKKSEEKKKFDDAIKPIDQVLQVLSGKPAKTEQDPNAVLADAGISQSEDQTTKEDNNKSEIPLVDIAAQNPLLGNKNYEDQDQGETASVGSLPQFKTQPAE